jgi:hypothetical protein
MGDKAERDIVKKQEQDMHTEHETGPTDTEPTGLVVMILSVVDLDMPLPLAFVWKRDNT